MADDEGLTKLQHRRLMRKSTNIIILMVLLLAAITVFVVKQSPPYEPRLKSVPLIEDDLLADLTLYKKIDTDRYEVYKDKLLVGDEYSFRVSVLRSTHVAVLLSRNNESPSLVFYTLLPPGKDRLVGKQGLRYRFKVTDSVQAVKFCVAYAEDLDAIREMNKKLDHVWQSLSDSVCVSRSSVFKPTG